MVEFQQQQSKQQLDAVDSYRLALLYYYLQDFNQATKAVTALLKADLSAPYLSMQKKEFIALKDAIDKKNSNLFQAKDIKKNIPFNLS